MEFPRYRLPRDVLDAVSMQRDTEYGSPPMLGRRVVVYGGNAAMDAALFEARRCMSCGNCFECDNCLVSARTTP